MRKHLFAALLVIVFFLQSFLSSLIKSPSWDEPAHIAAGLSYVEKGNFVPNPQHPPLLKELAGISMFIAGIRLPEISSVNAMFHEVPGSQLDWDVGDDVITQGGPERVLLAARLPLILVSTLLAALVYLWGTEIVGSNAALGALFLFALDPNLVAHSEFVTTDMGAAAFIFLFFCCLWRYLRRPGRWRLLGSGVAFGLCLCAKFSAIFMIPVALLLLLVAAYRSPNVEEEPEARGRRLWIAVGQFAAMSAVAVLVISLLYLSPLGVVDYYRGLRSVYADSRPDYLAFLAGRSQHRFLIYFAAAWLLKEPLATIGLVVFGSVILLQGKRLSRIDRLFVFLPPAVLFVACTLWAVNFGIRYLIPAFPFACLAGGIGLERLVSARSNRFRGLAAALCLWIVVAAAGIYPDHLSYFNESACLLRDPAQLGIDGGTRCGPWWLDDSNTDWGQGLEQLRVWRREHPDSRNIHLAYFGSFPPAVYGIVSEGSVFDSVPEPGLYVVSAKYLYRTVGWLKTAKPVAVVGHALYVYDIR